MVKSPFFRPLRRPRLFTLGRRSVAWHHEVMHWIPLFSHDDEDDGIRLKEAAKDLKLFGIYTKNGRRKTNWTKAHGKNTCRIYLHTTILLQINWWMINVWDMCWCLKEYQVLSFNLSFIGSGTPLVICVDRAWGAPSLLHSWQNLDISYR